MKRNDKADNGIGFFLESWKSSLQALNRKAVILTFAFVYLMGLSSITSSAHAEIVYLASSYGVTGYDSNGSNVFSWNVGVSAGGIVVDGAGNLYVSAGNSIEKMSTGGVVTTFASGLDGATGLAFDNGGNLYVSNIGDGTIDRIDTNGNVSLFAQVPGGASSPFYAIAVDGEGNVYVGNYVHNLADSIVKFDPSGNESIFVTNSAVLGSTQPAGIACDAQGNVYVSYTFGGQILKFTTNGTSSVFASGLAGQNSIAFDSSGNLFLSGVAGAIDEFNSNGDMSVFVAGGNSINQWGIAVWDVPEPSSLLLAATGLLFLAATFKRNRSTRSPWG